MLKRFVMAAMLVASSPFAITKVPAVAADACTIAQTSAFAPVAFLVGDWGGAGSAEGAAGSGHDTFRYELACRVLVRHAQSSYAGGGTYQGLLIIYPDAGASGGFRADSFDSGGHVIHYALVEVTQPNVAQFLSDGPTAQPTFRLTYTRHATDLEVTFEMAPPGSATFVTLAHGTERAT